MGTIVVGVDESTGAAAALRWAVEEARLRSCALTAVMCWDFIAQRHAPGESTDFDPSYDASAADRALEKIIAPVVADAGVPVTRRVVNDLAARGLLEAAADADLLVLGARGVGGFGALLLGSVSDQCLHHARVPVAIIRPREPGREPYGRIVVGVDGSETSRRALQWAVAEARLRHSGLSVVHAWSLPATALPYVPDMAPLEQASGELLDRALESLEGGLDPPINRELCYGAPAPVLLDAAENADLVVVGSRGVGGFKGLLLGSVSHRLATHARCPVVVIPHDHEAETT